MLKPYPVLTWDIFLRHNVVSTVQTDGRTDGWGAMHNAASYGRATQLNTSTVKCITD